MAKLELAGAGRLVTLIGAGAAALLTTTVATWEGKRNDPYEDIAGIMTVCYGETQAPMRRYSDAECKALLQARLADYAAPVLARNPELRGHAPQVVAATSLAYNIGPEAYARSTVARRFSAGDWTGACNGFLAWNKARVNGRLQPVRGLTRRREEERRICLTGLG